MFTRLAHRVARFLKSSDGASNFQYAIVAALIIAGLVLFIKNVGNATNNALANDSSQLVPASGS